MRTEHVPACHESPDVVDRLSPAMAAAMGLAAGTPMVAGAGDQAAAAIGAGLTAPGRLAATLGTSGVLFAASEHCTEPTHCSSADQRLNNPTPSIAVTAQAATTP